MEASLASFEPAGRLLGPVPILCTPMGRIPPTFSIHVLLRVGLHKRRLIHGLSHFVIFSRYRIPTAQLSYSVNRFQSQTQRAGACATWQGSIVDGKIDAGFERGIVELLMMVPEHPLIRRALTVCDVRLNAVRPVNLCF